MNRIRELANVVHRGGGFYAVIVHLQSDINEVLVLMDRHCIVHAQLAPRVWQVRFKK